MRIEFLVLIAYGGVSSVSTFYPQISPRHPTYVTYPCRYVAGVLHMPFHNMFWKRYACCCFHSHLIRTQLGVNILLSSKLWLSHLLSDYSLAIHRERAYVLTTISNSELMDKNC